MAAFLLMEAAGLGGAMLGVVLVPGLLAAGVGALIFVGLDDWTGFGTFSLAIPSIPHVGSPTVAEFLWALGDRSSPPPSWARASGGWPCCCSPSSNAAWWRYTPVVGLVVAGLAIVFAEITGRSSSEVLFSGQSALPSLIRTRPAGPSARSCCSSSARAWPTASR